MLNTAVLVKGGVVTQIRSVEESDAIEFMFANGWTDGLPVVPPTRSRVAAMVEAAGRDAESVLGSVVGPGTAVTTEFAAVNAVMAGCRPDYFNVVLTALEACLDPAFNLNTVATSTGGAAICVVVSGPGAFAIGMNAGHNALGTGNRANATIGRAVRLTVANALDAKTGRLDASSIGHPGKFTLCFAEKAETPPWDPHRVERGYTLEDTTVTVVATEGPRQIANLLNEDPEGVLRSISSAMRTPSTFVVGKGGQYVVVLGYEHALALTAGGWGKEDIRQYLTLHSRVSPAELLDGGVVIERGSQHDMTPGPDGLLPSVSSPDDLLVVAAGGPGAGWSALLPGWAPTIHSRMVTRRVRPIGEALPDCGPESCELPAAAGLRMQLARREEGTP
jgi:hypothetical protein